MINNKLKGTFVTAVGAFSGGDASCSGIKGNEYSKFIGNCTIVPDGNVPGKLMNNFIGSFNAPSFTVVGADGKIKLISSNNVNGAANAFNMAKTEMDKQMASGIEGKMVQPATARPNVWTLTGRNLIVTNSDENMMQLKVFNSLGSVVGSYSISGSSATISLSSFVAGTYWLKFSGSPDNSTHRIVIR